MNFRVWLKRLFAWEGKAFAESGTCPIESFWRLVCSLKTPVILVRGSDLQVQAVSEEAYELFGSRANLEISGMLFNGLDPYALSRVKMAVVSPMVLVADLPIRLPTSDRYVNVSLTVSHLAEYPGEPTALLFIKVVNKNKELPSWVRLTREVLARLPHPAWVTDGAGSIVFSNSAFSQFPLEFVRREPLSAKEFPDAKEWTRLTRIQEQLCALPKNLLQDDSLSDSSYDLGPYGKWRIMYFPLKSPESPEGFIGILAIQEAPSTLSAAATSWHRLSGVVGQAALTHVLQVRETERAAIAREIHDSLGQELTVLKLTLRRLATQVMANENAPGQVLENFQLVRQLVDNLTKSTRRIAYELRQDLVQVNGLAHTVQDLILDLRTRLGLPLQLELTPNWVEPEAGMAHHMHRSLQEMLNNVSKHAKANHCLVRLGCEESLYWLEVQDDGVGIDLQQKTGSIGLRSLSERAELYGGQVIIKTRPEVAGTIVRMLLPERRQASRNGRTKASNEPLIATMECST